MTETTPHASERDRHLFAPGRKRVLSLDGGGIRGMLTLGILERLEQNISDLEGRPTRLGEWFDLIGGTSAGALVASGLALGMTVAEIRDAYMRVAPRIFSKSWRRIPGVQAKFDARRVSFELEEILGSRTLDSDDLRTGLCITLKRLDTGSAWMLMNNPRSAFWEDPSDKRHVGNRHFRLSALIRASTAAPSFFAPELIKIVESEPPGIFIDGALTPNNNPSLQLMFAVLLPAFGLSWKSGPDDLLIVSVGTGSFRTRMTHREAKFGGALLLAVKALAGMIGEGESQILTLMSYFGQTPTRWTINSEIGEVARFEAPGGPLFRFLRYDARLETGWLEQELGVVLTQEQVAKLHRMDDPANADALLDLGREAAKKLIKLSHFSGFKLVAAVSVQPSSQTTASP